MILGSGAGSLICFLLEILVNYTLKQAMINPSENGIFLWDDDKNYPVVSAQNAFKQIAMKQTTPTSSIGAAGDGAGMIAWDGSYIYICTAAYDGSTAIWKRVALVRILNA